MNQCLFHGTIADAQAWGSYHKAKAFFPLIKYIYETNHLKFGEIIPVPGVSGVYKAGNTVVKLYYPPETELVYAKFYRTEINAMEFCKSTGVLTPEIIRTGVVRDSVYRFPYIVMANLDGIEASELLPGYDKSKKIAFSIKLKEITDKIHIKTGIDIPCYHDSLKIDSYLWARMPESFREDRKRYLAENQFPELVFQHGDLWDRNIFVDKQERLILIDFAESLIAPPCYDLGPMILNGPIDPVRLEAYLGEYRNEAFYEKFTLAWLLNWFGAIFIEWRVKELGMDMAGITSVSALKDVVVKLLG